MKYFAGTVEEENALTKLSADGAALRGQGKPEHGRESGALKFYYPMPDYKTPVSIYSDAYLPKKAT